MGAGEQARDLTTDMLHHRTRRLSVGLVAATLLVAAAPASAQRGDYDDPLLSGYGEPGAAEQMIFGDERLDGLAAMRGGGGDDPSSGAAQFALERPAEFAPRSGGGDARRAAAGPTDGRARADSTADGRKPAPRRASAGDRRERLAPPPTVPANAESPLGVIEGWPALAFLVLAGGAVAAARHGRPARTG